MPTGEHTGETAVGGKSGDSQNFDPEGLTEGLTSGQSDEETSDNAAEANASNPDEDEETVESGFEIDIGDFDSKTGEKKKVDPPRLTIKSISNKGLVTLGFSEELIEVEPESINKDVLAIEAFASNEDMKFYMEFTWKTI